MTEFRGIKVVAVPERQVHTCLGCVFLVDEQDHCGNPEGPDRMCYVGQVFQPASLHDGRPRLVTTNRQPQPDDAGIHTVLTHDMRLVTDTSVDGKEHRWNWHSIIAVERAKEGV